MLRPNHITFSSLLAALVGLFMPFPAGLGFFALSFLLDVLDGRFARKKGLVTEFGGIFDSVSDKIVEVLFIYYLASKLGGGEQAVIAAGFSVMISYVKHRSGIRARSFFDRAQRLIFLLVFSLLFPFSFDLFIFTFNLLCAVAILQLLIIIYNNIYKRHKSK